MYLLAIDPGELKCGCVILEIDDDQEAKLIVGWRPTVQKLGEFIETWFNKEHEPLILVYEKYRVYSHKLNAHRFSRVQTIEAIGMLEFLIKKYNITHESYMAGTWKGVVTDERLKREGFWGNYNSADSRHIHDAAGIGVYAWRFRGVTNGGRRVITKADKEKFGHM